MTVGCSDLELLCQKEFCPQRVTGLYTFGVLHKWGYPPNRWFIRENPIKLDDLWVPPLFVETSISHSTFGLFHMRGELHTPFQTIMSNPAIHSFPWAPWPVISGTVSQNDGLGFSCVVVAARCSEVDACRLFHQVSLSSKLKFQVFSRRDEISGLYMARFGGSGVPGLCADLGPDEPLKMPCGRLNRLNIG